MVAAALGQESRNVQELEHMPVFRLLLKYFLPSFAGFLVFSLYNIVDRIFIGQGVGPLALAALSAVFPIMLLQMAFGMLVGIGGSVRASIALGKKDFEGAERLLGHAFLLMLCVGLGITTFGFLVKDHLLGLFGITAQTAQYAGEYLDVILVGSTFSVVGYSLNNFIRAEGNARIAMVSMFISAGINTILDPIFIFGFGWGVQGAAWATVVAQVSLAVWVLWHFRSTRSLFRLKWEMMGFDWGITWAIATVGFSSFAMQMAGAVVQSAYNVQLVKFGSDYAMSAIGIINSVSQLLIIACVALNQAGQPIYGYSQGAKNFRRMRECLGYSLVLATAIASLGFALVQLFPAPLVKLFEANDSELLRVGVHSMRIFFAAFPLVGFQVVVGGYFQSVGKAGKSAILALLRQLIFLLPFMLVLPHYLGLTGVWLSAPLSDACSAVVCAAFIWVEILKLNRKILSLPQPSTT